jgi:hypothetical protein
MAVAAKSKTAARTPTRPEPETARIPESRMAAEERTPERDPNKIYTRDGRVVDLERVKRQSDDRLDVAAMGIIAPQGWVYQWRTRSVKNAPWVQAIADDEEAGWTPVPADRHPGKIMPRGHQGPIEYNGLMLMERDARLEALAQAYRLKAANEQLTVSRSMAGLMHRAAPGAGAIADFDHGAAQRATGVKIERQARTNDAQYNYTLDE